MTSLLITGARVYDHDGDVDQPPVADVLIEDSTITATGEEVERALGAQRRPERTLDARGMLLVPGFVNAHYHSYDLLAKGLFEEVPLEVWRHYTARMAANRPREEVRLRTLLGAVECLKNGITTVQDMSIQAYDPSLVETILEAYDEAGIRVVFSVSVRDLPDADTIPYVRELFAPDLLDAIGARAGDPARVMAFLRAQLERHRSARLHWALSPSAPHRCSEPMMKAIVALAEERGLPVYTHLYEALGHALQARERHGADGGSLVRYMDRVGLLGTRLSVAHGLWSRPDELDLLARRGARVVVNAVSNLKLKDGVPPVNELRRAGVALAFGCDCFSCSDTQNLFQSMKLCCLLAAAESPHPGLLSAAEAVRIATAGGAATAGLDAGAIRRGMKADLVLLDLADPSFVPFNSAARQIVFSETGRAVHTVIVDGRVVVRERCTTTLEERSLQEALAEAMPAYRAEFRRVERELEPLARAFAAQAARVNACDVGIERYPRRQAAPNPP
ncbi:MAG: amidohydrolase family protein [Burkholderiales bacterium]|nr:amidohydrolase family protein [Burkholderiales bacterium]